ncbi:TonB-dependent receptor domain-containing protein, partial [Salmonella enterica]|uniref:TonB-dependent receptor domain-containing protein n=1 Tax=Salmonella enterica TaxID=28901 RepID=UPI003D2A96BD
NASAFWYDYKNKQETNYINTFVGALAQLTNVPRSRIRGVEVDARWQATPELLLTASTTYLDAKVTNWPDAGSTVRTMWRCPPTLPGRG